MSITYAQKQVPAQKKEAPGAVSIHDSSLQGEALQRKADLVSGIVQRIETPHPNNTGMPDNLKSGIESLSGYSMDNVRVHYNSSKPATVQALAYTQGTDIHVAPGQEKHLPHEAWHVAQQMAGRVAPTTNINGMPVNDNATLEHEADVMGEKAVTQRKEACGLNEGSIGEGVCQRTEIHYHPMTINYIPENFPGGKLPTETVGHITNAILTAGQPVHGTGVGNGELDGLMNAIKPGGRLNKRNLYIKGHLLNAQLGGLGISKNLIPITENANQLHEIFVEQGVKNLVYANEKIFKRQMLTSPPFVTYNVQANVLNEYALSKKNPPEVLLSCNVTDSFPNYGNFSWKATIHSGPTPGQASADGNITEDVNDFLNRCLQPLNEKFLNVSNTALENEDWGNAQHKTDSGNLTDNKGDDLRGTGIIDWDEKTDDVRVDGKKIHEEDGLLPIPNPINTFYHKSTEQTINSEVCLFYAMRAIDNIKEAIKREIASAPDKIKACKIVAKNAEVRQREFILALADAGILGNG